MRMADTSAQCVIKRQLAYETAAFRRLDQVIMAFVMPLANVLTALTELRQIKAIRSAYSTKS